MKELLLFRHAKSSWNSAVPDDFSRPLSRRGVEDARLMGEVLRDMDCLPQCIHLSSAARTTQTCDLFLQAAQSVNTPCYAAQRLYHAGSTALVETMQALDDSDQRVMLLGHNPGLESFLLHLCPDVPFMANGKLLTTANIAVLRLDVERWRDFDRGEVRLLSLLRPKEINQ